MRPKELDPPTPSKKGPVRVPVGGRELSVRGFFVGAEVPNNGVPPPLAKAPPDQLHSQVTPPRRPKFLRPGPDRPLKFVDHRVEDLVGNAPSKALPIDPGAAVSSLLASARMQCAVVLGRVQGQLASRGPPAPLDTPAGCEIRRLRAQGRGRLDGTPTSTSA